MTEQTTPAPELDVEAIRAVLEPPVICSQGGFRINDYHLSKLELALRSTREEIERLKAELSALRESTSKEADVTGQDVCDCINKWKSQNPDGAFGWIDLPRMLTHCGLCIVRSSQTGAG